jgi:hypothetical protein
MTTKITIDVPESADYVVEFTTDSPRAVTLLLPGRKYELYLHTGLSVAGIREVPLHGTKKLLP